MERTVGVGGVGVLLWGRLGTPTHFTHYSLYSHSLSHSLSTLIILLCSLYITHTLTHTLTRTLLTFYSLYSAAAAMLWSAPHFARAARLRIGTRAERSTPRKLGGSSAKAPRKLSSSTAMQHAAGSRSDYFLNFAYTLE